MIQHHFSGVKKKFQSTSGIVSFAFDCYKILSPLFPLSSQKSYGLPAKMGWRATVLIYTYRHAL
jgi:hypothetical protein